MAFSSCSVKVVAMETIKFIHACFWRRLKKKHIIIAETKDLFIIIEINLSEF